MFRFEGPILNPALALRPILDLRPVLASALHACVRQPPHEGPPLVSCGEHAGGAWRGDAHVRRSPCTREPCCIHACGQGQGVGRACLPQAIP